MHQKRLMNLDSSRLTEKSEGKNGVQGQRGQEASKVEN